MTGEEPGPTPNNTDTFNRRRILKAGLALGTMAIAPLGCAGPSSATTEAVAATGAAPTGTAAAGAAASKVAAPPAEPRLTVHAIDTYRGATEAGLRFDLSFFENGGYRLLKKFETLAGGRTKDPLLVRDELKTGRYEITLHLAEYYSKIGTQLPQPPFLDDVLIRFSVADAAQRYHVAMLFSPWNYSYYRGS